MSPHPGPRVYNPQQHQINLMRRKPNEPNSFNAPNILNRQDLAKIGNAQLPF